MPLNAAGGRWEDTCRLQGQPRGRAGGTSPGAPPAGQEEGSGALYPQSLRFSAPQRRGVWREVAEGTCCILTVHSGIHEAAPPEGDLPSETPFVESRFLKPHPMTQRRQSCAGRAGAGQREQ